MDECGKFCESKEYIDRETAKKEFALHFGGVSHAVIARELLDSIPSADVVEVDKVAEMLRISFGDDCACNFNCNDEWLWEKCKYAETDCPYPKDDNGCWKEFVKHFIAKIDGKGGGK